MRTFRVLAKEFQGESGGVRDVSIHINACQGVSGHFRNIQRGLSGLRSLSLEFQGGLRGISRHYKMISGRFRRSFR